LDAEDFSIEQLVTLLSPEYTTTLHDHHFMAMKGHIVTPTIFVLREVTNYHCTRPKRRSTIDLHAVDLGISRLAKQNFPDTDHGDSLRLGIIAQILPLAWITLIQHTPSLMRKAMEPALHLFVHHGLRELTKLLSPFNKMEFLEYLLVYFFDQPTWAICPSCFVM
jgi:hypothetical protein